MITRAASLTNPTLSPVPRGVGRYVALSVQRPITLDGVAVFRSGDVVLVRLGGEHVPGTAALVQGPSGAVTISAARSPRGTVLGTVLALWQGGAQ